MDPIRKFLNEGFWNRSLMVRLVASFLLLSVVMITLVAAIAYYSASQALQTSAFMILDTAATYKEEALHLWLDERLQDVRAIARSSQVQAQTERLFTTSPEDEAERLATYEELTEQLSTLTVGNPDLREIFILANDTGNVELSTLPSHEGENAQDEKYFSQGKVATFIHGIYTDPETGEPLITIATPLLAPSGQRLGVLVAHLDLAGLNSIVLERAGLGATGETYLVDPAHRLVLGQQLAQEPFARNVRSEGIDAALDGEDGNGLYRNYAGVPVIGVYRWIANREMALIVEMQQREALTPARNLAVTVLLIGLTSTVALGVGVYWLARQIAHPILAIADTAAQVAEGDLSQTVPVLTRDETGTLARAFNQMIGQVRDLIATQEQRVNARTRDLQIAAEVSKQITTELRISDLLQKVATVTSERFELYGSFVFLLDESNRMLTRAAGADAWGRPTALQSNNTIPLDATPSVIAQAARMREAVLVNDTETSLIFLPELSLPKTRAELAIPMVRGERLVGVFDLQSDEPEHFTPDDVRVLTTLAEQIAIAVRNAQLFTEMLAAKESAEVASQAKSVFLTNVSHELRTPLTSVFGFAKIIKRKLNRVVFPALGEQRKERRVQRAIQQVNDNIDIIIAEGERLTVLINDVLDLAEIEADKIAWAFERVHIEDVIEQAVEQNAPQAQAKRLPVLVEIEDDLPAVCGDQDRLVQAIDHLISNAIKFTYEGHVRVASRKVQVYMSRGLQAGGLQPGTWVVVSVQDTGIGIAQEDYDKLFKTFVQISDPLRDKPQGAGLGLSICKEIIEHHGGHIWVESEEGVGSTFTFTLPLAGEEKEKGEGERGRGEKE